MEKKEVVRIITPKGDAIYPKLFTPDTKFNPEGDFKITLAVPKAEAEPFIESLKQFRAMALANAKEQILPKGKQLSDEAKENFYSKLVEKNPWEEMVDDEGKPTGKVKFNFKQRAVIKRKDGTSVNIKPVVCDATGAVILADPGIGNGSQVRVNFTPAVYYTAATKQYGLSLRLNGVRVIELKKWVKGANLNLFGDAEEGFSVANAPATGEGDVDF